MANAPLFKQLGLHLLNELPDLKVCVGVILATFRISILKSFFVCWSCKAENEPTPEMLIMKSCLFFLYFFFTLSSIRAQVVDTLPFFVAKKGIYTSYTSLRNNTPNRQDSFHIVTRTKGDIFLVGGGPFEFLLDSAEKNEWRALRKALVGISDGTQFYISDKYTCGGWMGISKCYLNGPYILSLSRANAAQYGGGLILSFANIGAGTVINLRTREHYPLNERFIKDLLKLYPDLEEEYKDRKGLLYYAIDILEKVNEKESNPSGSKRVDKDD